MYSTDVGPGWSQTADVKKPNFFVGEKHIRCEMHLFFPFSEKNGPENFALGRKRKMELEGKCFFLGI